MNGYVCFYGDKRLEIYALTMSDAKQEVIKRLKIPMSKWGLISVVLCEVSGRQIETTITD